MNANTMNNDATMPEGGVRALLLNRYRIIRQLGQGGMGSVWLAEDVQLDGKLFAIKMLPSILVTNKRAYLQLKSEALVSMKLVHSNIVALRAFEENNGNPFLVMDYIDGQTLDEYLADRTTGCLSEEETITLLKPVAEALDYAHKEGVVHRDVKPANVMIRKDGHPFVLDFGIAREIQETMTRVTGKMSSGTLLYMSPEQLRGLAPKASQDVYSFATMVYECLKGNPPFYRGAIEDQIKNEKPEPLACDVENSSGGGSKAIRPAIADSVMAALEKNPEDRPKSCLAVLTGGSVRNVEKSSKVYGAVAGKDRSQKAVLGKILIGLLLLGVVVAGALLAARDGDESTDPQAQITPKPTNDGGQKVVSSLVVTNDVVQSTTPPPERVNIAEQPIALQPVATNDVVESAIAPPESTNIVVRPPAPVDEKGDDTHELEMAAKERELVEREKALVDKARILEEAEKKRKLEEQAKRDRDNDAERKRKEEADRKRERDDEAKRELEAETARLKQENEEAKRKLEELEREQEDFKHKQDELTRKKNEELEKRNAEAERRKAEMRRFLERLEQCGFILDDKNNPRPAGTRGKLPLRNGSHIEMIWCPPGYFMMGSRANNDGSETRHPVHISKGFWLGKYEVTESQWRDVIGFCSRSKKPKTNVSYEDCERFCRAFPAEYGVCLPSEAEWEYACRSGTQSDYSLGRLSDGAKIDGDKANIKAFWGVKDVGEYEKYANAWGFCDMHGNVREWCADIYKLYENTDSLAVDPIAKDDGDMGTRTVRGGFCREEVDRCRSASRSAGKTDKYTGFRIKCSNLP